MAVKNDDDDEEKVNIADTEKLKNRYKIVEILDEDKRTDSNMELEVEWKRKKNRKQARKDEER